MPQLVHPGYIGIAKIGSAKIRCSGFNVNPVQNILWYDHIVGLRDSTPTTLGAKGEATSFPNNLQKTFFRPSVKIIQGTMDFPLTENIGDTIFQIASTGEWFDLEFDYYCESSRTFVDCKINSYTLSVRAGDIATVSLNIIGIGMSETISVQTVGNYTDAEKLVTWDTMDITISNSGQTWDGLSSFDMTINNNVQPVYTSGANQRTGNPVANDLNPFTLRVGMQHVTGTVTKYNKNYRTREVDGVPISILVQYPQAVTIDMLTLFKPMTVDGVVGPIISAYGYEALDKHFY